MKFINISNKKLLAVFATFALIFSLVSGLNIRKTDAEILERNNEGRRAKAHHVYKPQSNPPYSNKTNLTLPYTFNKAVNNSVEAGNMRDFKSINMDSKFHKLFDKQLEEIFLILKKKNMVGVDDFRSAYGLFIKYFAACDKDKDLLLNKKEFAACMKNDPYMHLQQPPMHLYSAMRNFTNATGYHNDLYHFANNYDEKGLNFYDYVMLRFFNFAWRKCTVSNKFMDEATWECAIDIISGTRSLNTNTLRNVFQMGLKMVNTKSMPVRTFDFLTFFALGSSIKLYGKINAKENMDSSISEFNIALDTNQLPTRYSQDIINQLFRLVRKDPQGRNGIDLASFVFYDHYLKMFYQGATENRWTINLKEFANICKSPMFPNFVHNYIKHVPIANFTHQNYNLRAHMNTHHLDEDEFFGQKFLELGNEEKAQRFNNTNYTKKVVKLIESRVFNLLDSNNNQHLTFYDWGNFIQTLTLYAKTDSRDADRVIVSDVEAAFSGYSDLPMYSSEFKARSRRFAQLDQDLYLDPFFTLAITRMDDYVHHHLRRSDPTTVREIEMHLILDKINLKNFPAAYLEKCNRGKDDNGIPKYDWECGIITAINRALKYLEYSRDMHDIKKHGFNLTYTQYDYASSK